MINIKPPDEAFEGIEEIIKQKRERQHKRESRAEELRSKYMDYAEILNMAEGADLDLCIAKAKQNVLQDISLTMACIYDEMRGIKGGD